MIETQLPDGTKVAVRPIRPDDKQLLVTGMERLSERSRRHRFLTGTDRLSRAQLAYLTEIDGHDHQAWGVLVDEEPVAIGRFVRTTESDAEVALTVVDDWQQRGIGTLLLELLVQKARDEGIERFTFVALPENTAIASLLAGFGVTPVLADGLATFTLPLSRV